MSASGGAVVGGVSGESTDPDQVEVWFHEDCICWMSDVRIVGHVILGNDKLMHEWLQYSSDNLKQLFHFEHYVSFL